MKGIAIIALAAVSSLSFGQLWNQSAMVNMPGAGTGAIAGANLSMLETNETTYGYGSQTTANNIMADDFTVGAGGWNVTGLTFWTYQTGATAPTITGASFAIDSTLTNTTLTAASSISVTMTGIYRVSGGDTASSGGLRQLQRVDVTGLNMNLAAGTYWLKWNFAGTLASGPWQPHIPGSLATYGNNGQQSIAAAAFAPVFSDSGLTHGADLPFQIQGQAVPEPATMTVLALAGLAALRRRKASK